MTFAISSSLARADSSCVTVDDIKQSVIVIDGRRYGTMR